MRSRFLLAKLLKAEEDADFDDRRADVEFRCTNFFHIDAFTIFIP